MINYRRDLAKNILAELSKSTSRTLTTLQKMNVPQIHNDLEILNVESREYKFIEIKYKSTADLLLRVIGKTDIKRSNFKDPYNGDYITLLDKDYINPILLTINGEIIDPTNMNIITDDRYFYIEVKNFREYNVKYGYSQSYTTLNGVEEFFLPAYSNIDEENIYIDFIIDNKDSIEDMYINDAQVLPDTDGNYMFKTRLLVTGKSNKLSITFNNAHLRTIQIVSNVQKKKAFISGKVILMNMDIDYSIDNYDEDSTLFIIMNGMSMTRDQFIMMPMYNEDVFFINKTYSNIYYKEGIAEDLDDPFIELEEYRFWPENFIAFEDNYVYYNTIDNLFTSIGDIDILSTEKYTFKLFFYPNTSKSIDHSLRLNQSQFDDFNTNIIVADGLFKIFDFGPDPELSHEENIEEMFKQIMTYNTEFVNKYFDNFSRIKQIYYTGQDILNNCTLDQDNNMVLFKVSKIINNRMNNNALFFYKGLLIQPFHETHDMYTLSFDFDDLDIDSTLDVLFYLNIENYVLTKEPNSIDTVGKYFPYKIHPKDTLFFNNIPLSPSSLLSYKEDRYFPVEFTYNISDDNKSVLYNTSVDFSIPIIQTSKRQFRYMQFVPIEYGANIYPIHLNSDFKFCQNIDHYAIFVNGHRIDNDRLLYVPHREDLPIDNHYILLAYKLKYNDIVDVYYLPYTLNSISFPALPENGMINLLNRDTLGYPLTDQSVQIYINGKKISKSSMKIISSFGFALTVDPQTRGKVTIIKNIDDSDDMFDLYRNTLDIWSYINRNIPIHSLRKLHNLDSKFMATDVLTNYNSNNWDIHTLKYEVLRKHWLEGITTLDPLDIYLFSLLEYNIHKVEQITEICRSYLNVWASESSYTIVEDRDIPQLDILDNIENYTSIFKEDNNGYVRVLYRDFDVVPNKPMSVSLFVWLNYNIEDHSEGISVRGFLSENDAIGYYLGSLTDKDGNILLKDIPKGRWVRLFLNNFTVPTYIKKLRISFDLKYNTIISFTYGRFDISKYTKSGLMVIDLDPSVVSVNNLPF